MSALQSTGLSNKFVRFYSFAPHSNDLFSDLIMSEKYEDRLMSWSFTSLLLSSDIESTDSTASIVIISLFNSHS